MCGWFDHQVVNLFLSSFDLGSQVMSRVTLRDVLRQGALARQQVAGQMDCLRVPHLAVLERELRRLQHGKEPQLRPDTEVSHHSIQCLVEQSVFPDFRLNETREASCFVC